MHMGINNVDNITNGKDIPSIPSENFKLSLFNHENEFTNWKCGISFSKFNGIYSDNKKLIIDVHNADFFACNDFSSSSTDNKTNTSPTSGTRIKSGKMGIFNILYAVKIYANKYC